MQVSLRSALDRFTVGRLALTCTAILALLAVDPTRSLAAQVDESAFGAETQTTTFDDLGLPITPNFTPLEIDGHTITTDDGMFRYWDFGILACESEDCISDNTDLGFVDIVLSEAFDRAGAYASAASPGYTVRADFFDASDVLLGSVILNNPTNGEPLFAGWEDPNGVARIRFQDLTFNGRLLYVDELMVESDPVQRTFISFGRQAAQPDDEQLNGTAATINDVVDVDTGDLLFNKLTELELLGDLDGFHALENGNVLYSSEPYVFGVPDVGIVHPGDVIEYDPNTDTFSLFFNNNNFVGLGNVDAVSISPDGNLLLSTKGPGNLPGLGAFQDGDVVEWDGSSASIYLAEEDIFTSGANNGVDAIHSLGEDGIIISPRTDGKGGIGDNGLDYDADSADLFQIDLSTEMATRFLDGEHLWDSGNTRQTDAAYVFVPESAVACPCWDAAFLASEVQNPSPCGNSTSTISSLTLARGADSDGCSGLARATIRFDGSGNPNNGMCVSNSFEFLQGRCMNTPGIMSAIDFEEFMSCTALVLDHCP